VIQLPFDIQRASAEVRSHYISMINAGQSPRFAEMCALQQPPGTKGTDRAFQEGRLAGNQWDELPARQAKKMIREAKAAGINISGKQYVSGLANKLGHCDPRAWVSDLSDVKRVAKDRNLNVSGLVNIEATELPPIRHDLNPRIAKELAKKEIAKNPKLSMQEALVKVKEKHTPKWKKPAH
jgi:post-segregation antitoxin (ccd killing protein)